MSKHTIRAAAAQFGVGTNVQENLQTCLRLIDQAAQKQPDVLVLPEFVNHIAWYADAEHCWRAAVSLEDEFIEAIGRKARQHGCYIKINVTLKRQDGKVTGTNLLFDRQGSLAGWNDKQILMGNENNFLEKASQAAPIIETDFGRVGMYACMDGVIPEVARALAVRGAHILLNSLNSFAYDEAALHIPVRAAENKVFVVAANKVGPLVPPDLREAVAARLKIAPHFLEGAGESQIVAPDGSVLAKAPRRGEAVIWAELDPRQAEDKRRPDGTHIFASRQPERYAPLAQPSSPGRQSPAAKEGVGAVIQIEASGAQAVQQAAEWVQQAEAAQAQIIVLPELFHITTLPDAEAQSRQMVERLQRVLQQALIATSIVEDGTHTGILFDRRGIVLRQPQLHPCARHAWSKLGRSVNVFDAPWGRVALVVGGDAIFPETFRLAALQGAQVVAVPTAILEPWECNLGLPERAAENRFNVLAASRAHSGIYAVSEDFTLWTEWKNRPFDGNINTPLVTRASGPGPTLACIYPAAAENKMISHRTDVLHGRPWHLAEPLIRQQG